MAGCIAEMTARPPGLMTRRASLKNGPRSARCSSTNPLTTRSKLWAGNGSGRARSWATNRTPSAPGFRRASASIPSEKSTAVTAAPASASQSACRPVPQPRSRTASPCGSPTAARTAGPSSAWSGLPSRSYTAAQRSYPAWMPPFVMPPPQAAWLIGEWPCRSPPSETDWPSHRFGTRPGLRPQIDRLNQFVRAGVLSGQLRPCLQQVGQQAGNRPPLRWGERLPVPVVFTPVCEVKEELRSVPRVGRVRFIRGQPREGRHVVRESLRGDEAERVPTGVADVLDPQGLGIARAQEIVVLAAFLAVPVVGEMLRTRAVPEGRSDRFQNLGVGRHRSVLPRTGFGSPSVRPPAGADAGPLGLREVPAAERYVPVVAPDLHLVAGPLDRPVRPDPDHYGRLPAAVADRLQLAQGVRPGQQSRTAGEEFAPEVGPQAVAHDRDVGLVHHPGQLPDLRLAEELGLVDEHAAGLRIGQEGPEIGVGVKLLGVGPDPDPGRDPSAGPVVQPGGEQPGGHPPLGV